MHRADRIRNVALVGHRGSGKTSLYEALLFEAGVINRAGHRRSTAPPSPTPIPTSRRARCRSALALNSFEWQERKINLLDTPGEPSFVADALGALRVCESADLRRQRGHGRRGLDEPPVGTRRRARHRAPDLREHARPRARRLLPHARRRSRAPSARTSSPPRSRSAPSTRCAASIDLVDMKAYEYASADARLVAREIPIPDDLQATAEEYREKLMDEVAEVSESLMERYLEGEEISHEEIVTALKDGTNHGAHLPRRLRRRDPEPRHQPAARRDRRGPAVAGQARRPRAAARSRSSPTDDKPTVRLRLQDAGRPVRRPDQPLPRLPGRDARTTRHVLNTRAHAKERIGQLLSFAGQGARRTPTSSGPGDIGAVAKLKETRAGDWLADARRADRDARDQAARAGHGVRDRARPRATRTRSSRRCAACRRRTRRSTCIATRRPATRSSPACRRSTSRSSSTA